jgi:hypothetical protein
LRNDIFASKDSVANVHTLDISKLKGADLKNIEYQRLLTIREKLVQDPERILSALSVSIDVVFSKYEVNSNDIQTIETRVNNTSDENFDAQLQSILGTMGHV